MLLQLLLALQLLPSGERKFTRDGTRSGGNIVVVPTQIIGVRGASMKLVASATGLHLIDVLFLGDLAPGTQSAAIVSCG